MKNEDFDSLYDIRSGCHLYQFYKSTEDYVTNIASFFRTGLIKGDACLWLVDEKMGLDRVHDLASNYIPQFLLYLCTGQLTILSANQWYLKDGHFNEEQAIANAESYIKKTLEKGYKCIRGAGDCGTIAREDWSQVSLYEQKMHAMIKGLPLIAVCAYPILDCSLSETQAVICGHDRMMVGHF